MYRQPRELPMSQKYRQWAEKEGLLTAEKLPSIDELYALFKRAFPLKKPAQMFSLGMNQHTMIIM